jgi:hypothetical protein
MPPAHPRTISNNHYLLLQQGSSFCSFFGCHDSDDSAAFPSSPVGRPSKAAARHAATLLSPALRDPLFGKRISETTVHGLVEPVMRRGGL